MFCLTREWLQQYYGSQDEEQYRQTNAWLVRYGTPEAKHNLVEWSNWKHLSEYQVNTPDIVPQCLAKIGHEFKSELQAHRYVNNLRVPNASTAYMGALKSSKPATILELGVGGDSAISTSVFLRYLEKSRSKKKAMLSVDRNPLGMTLKRYKDVPYWQFQMNDSVAVLMDLISRQVFYDMVFIDTIHSYDHTMQEINMASKITDYILLDDATFAGNDFDPNPGGVKRAIEEWYEKNKNEWKRKDYADNTVCLLYKKPLVQPRKLSRRKKK